MGHVEKSSTAKRRRLHKRTIAVVFLFVLLPWILIAIPKTSVEGAGTTGLNINHSVYGWPLVHLESTEYRVTGNWVNGIFYSGQMPPGLDLAEKARDAAATFAQDKKPFQLNLRLERDEDWHAQWSLETGYWSDLSNWPVLKMGTHFTPRYVGMLLNLICLALLALIVAAVCEFKIRRHQRLLKFSMANLFIGIALLAVCVAWMVQVQREKVGVEALQALARKSGSSLWHIETNYQARFSLVVSQLLNHGKYPWVTTPFFRQVKSGRITVDLDEGSDLQEIESIAKGALEAHHSIDLRVFNFNPDRQRMLNLMDRATVVALYLDFDTYDWIGQEVEDEKPEEERKRSGVEVDLVFDLRNLEEIRLGLDPAISQVEQLEPFLGLPSLKWASISGLSAEGAEFIFETKTKWPQVMLFAYLDGVPDELKQKLESQFEEHLPSLGGGVF